LGWATTSGDGDRYEVVLYLPLEAALAHARMLETTLAESLALWAESVVAGGASHVPLLSAGVYASLSAADRAPGLLSEPRRERVWELPEIRLAASGWEPIGLGAIQDLVQEAFGPVELDRPRDRLERAARRDPRCPACVGASFAFPAELEEQRELMCGPHQALAEKARNDRLARAAASNPDGWGAIVEASARLSRPSHGIPFGVFSRLERLSERDPLRRLSVEELRGDAEVALALGAAFAGRPSAFADFLFENDLFAGDWLIELPFALAGAGRRRGGPRRRGLRDAVGRERGAVRE